MSKNQSFFIFHRRAIMIGCIITPIMNVQELTIIGKILCGNRWQAQFARLLGVSPVTVSRWVKGKQTISPALERAIYRLSDKPPFVRQKEKRLRAELNVFAHKRITLYHARADSVSLDCSIDTIICSPFDTKPLSDISQSIESVQYLRTVLHNLASKLSENGKIIVLLPWNTDPRVLNAVPYTSGYVGSQYISTILKCDSKIAYQFGGGECVFSGEAPLFKNSDERVELEEWLLKTCTRTCEVICDPFMGEGRFMHAAFKLSRHYIGVESDLKYWRWGRAMLARGFVPDGPVLRV